MRSSLKCSSTPSRPCLQVESHRDGLVSPSLYRRIDVLVQQISFALAYRMNAIFSRSPKTCFRLIVHYWPSFRDQIKVRSMQGHGLRQVQIRVELPTETPLRALDARHVLRPQLKGFIVGSNWSLGRGNSMQSMLKFKYARRPSHLFPRSVKRRSWRSAEKFPDPQKNHNNAETKPGQDTEGQCSIAELIGRLTTRDSASDFQIGGLLDHVHGSGSLFGISSFLRGLMTRLPCCHIPRCNEAIVAEGLRVKKVNGTVPRYDGGWGNMQVCLGRSWHLFPAGNKRLRPEPHHVTCTALCLGSVAR